jgi:hypothetical protein
VCLRVLVDLRTNRALVSSGGLRPHGQDRLGNDRGPDRVLLTPRLADYRAHWLSPDDGELGALKAADRQRLAAGQAELDLASGAAPGGPLKIISTRMSHLHDALSRAYGSLGFAQAARGDEVSRQLVLARIIEPAGEQDSLRVLEEAGIDAVSYPALNRRLPACAQDSCRRGLAAACAAHARLDPASLVRYDVSTLYFVTNAGDGFHEPGFSTERRFEPQITIGLLTDVTGFPLMIEAFEGNKAETKTMLP